MEKKCLVKMGFISTLIGWYGNTTLLCSATLYSKYAEKKYYWAVLGATGLAASYYGFRWLKQKHRKQPKQSSLQVSTTLPSRTADQPHAIAPSSPIQAISDQQTVQEDSTDAPADASHEILPSSIPFSTFATDGKRFHITVYNQEIRIKDYETKQTTALEAPSWLKDHAGLQPSLAIGPLQRFFILAAGKYYQTYALDHEIWKLGTSMHADCIDSPLFCKEPATPINILSVSIGDAEVGSLGRAPSVTMNRFYFTLEGLEEPWRQGYDVLVPYQLSQVPDVEEAFIAYAECAYKGIKASKYIALKTGMSPANSLHPHHRKDLGIYHQQVLAFKHAPQTTNLRQGILTKICHHMQQNETMLLHNPRLNGAHLAALNVFSDIYQTFGLENRCCIVRLMP